LYTWSSDPHTTGGLGTLADPWLPKAPVLSVDLGARLGRAP
jgi:hypothetical protein